MRPIFVLLATALMLSACNNDEIQQNQPQAGSTQMSFTMADAVWEGIPNARTRASGIVHNSMSVYGYYTGVDKWNVATGLAPNLFNRQEVVFDGVKWAYTPLKYWFPTGYHHFFAFAPHSATSFVSIVDGTPSLVHSVPTGARNQVDLLWALENGAEASANNRSSQLDQTVADNKVGDTTTPLRFTFHHALTRIAFAANVGAALDENRYSITSIALQNVYYEGVSKFKITKPNPSIDAVTGATWLRPDGNDKQRDFLVTKNGGGLKTDVRLTRSSQLITALTTDIIPEDYDGYMYMIPQPIESSTQGTLPSMSATIHDHTLNQDFIVKGALPSPGTSGWHPNQAITYSITYNGGGDTPFAIEAKVTDWNDQPVPTIIHGTYLNVSHTEVTSYTVDNNVKIYYSTDGSPVTGVYNGGTITPLPNRQGVFEFLAEPGITYATITAGSITRRIRVIRTMDPSSIIPVELDNSYVGAFWRASQTGERIIRIETPSGAEGEWDAQVIWMDDQWGDDRIRFSTAKTKDINVSFTSDITPADMNDPNNDALYNVNGGASSAKGITVAGEYIYFRMGVSEKNRGTKPRYAVVLMRYAGLTKNHLIYLRQGDQADYVFRITDSYGNSPANVSAPNWRPAVREFSPYNLTDANMGAGGTNVTNHNQLTVNGGAFTAYPSQAGAFFQWGLPIANATQIRRAYHPTNSTSSFSGTPGTGNGDFWAYYHSGFTGLWGDATNHSANNETCPPAFRRPNDGKTDQLTSSTVNNSEFRQSLQLNPADGSGSDIGNSVWGYYADGFFDRRLIRVSVSFYQNTAVSFNTKDVAYIGRLYFNPNNYASLFFPAAGERRDSNGLLRYAGLFSTYWSSSAATIPGGMALQFNSGISQYVGANKVYGYSVRCVRQP